MSEKPEQPELNEETPDIPRPWEPDEEEEDDDFECLQYDIVEYCRGYPRLKVIIPYT